MKAAVVTSFDRPPRHGDFDRPVPREGEVVVDVKAAAVSQLVRSRASGKHYSIGVSLPFVPGVDGVGRLADGRRVYFAFPRDPFGSMAEASVVSERYCCEIPDEVSDVTAAAIANPGMSSWAALTERAGFVKGESVLVHGATGASGRLAVQIARHLGARRVVATGRNRSSLEALGPLGADAMIPLEQEDGRLIEAFQEEIAKGVDVILDYLWGPPAERLIQAFSGRGSAGGAPRVRYVQIGSMAGGSITLPAGPLRSSGLEILGSGLGSVSHERLVQAIRGVLGAVVPARLAVDARAVPLAEVETAWDGEDAGRLVLTV